MLKLLNNNKGQSAIIVCIAFPIFLIMIGLCLDGGLMLYYKTKLMAAVKFTAISSTAINQKNGDMLEITANGDFARAVLEKNFKDAKLTQFEKNPLKLNECTVSASFKTQYIFMWIFNYTYFEITETYTATRNFQIVPEG